VEIKIGHRNDASLEPAVFIYWSFLHGKETFQSGGLKSDMHDKEGHPDRWPISLTAAVALHAQVLLLR